MLDSYLDQGFLESIQLTVTPPNPIKPTSSGSLERKLRQVQLLGDRMSMEIKQAQKDTELLVNEATTQLNSQKEKALVALEEQVNTLSEQIKNKLLSSQLKA
jgi:hypothetical protein